MRHSRTRLIYTKIRYVFLVQFCLPGGRGSRRLSTRYELANGFTSIPSRLLGDLEEKHLPQTFSIATRVAHDGIRIAVTSVRIALSNLKVQHLKDLLESRRSCSGAST